MRQKALKLCFVGLMVLLIGTACVRVDSEIRLNSAGQIEEVRGGVALEDASILSLVNVPEEQLEEHILLWILTGVLEGFNRDEVLGIEGYIDLAQVRAAGLDLEAEGLWDEVTMIRDHGVDPETGHLFIEYLLELPELPDGTAYTYATSDLAAELGTLNDPMLASMFGDQMPSPLRYRVVTRMPGKIVSSSDGQTMRGQPDVHIAEVNLLTLIEGPQVLRVVADPEQRVLPYSTVDMKPHQAMQKDVWESGRYWLTDQVAVQEVTFREGEHFPEIAGQISNVGNQSYQWVSLGLSLFDAEGRFIDYHSLMISNVAAGAERGFHKRLLHGDLLNAAYYRLEWAMGF